MGSDFEDEVNEEMKDEESSTDSYNSEDYASEYDNEVADIMGTISNNNTHDFGNGLTGGGSQNQGSSPLISRTSSPRLRSPGTKRRMPFNHLRFLANALKEINNQKKGTNGQTSVYQSSLFNPRMMNTTPTVPERNVMLEPAPNMLRKSQKS